MTDRRLNGRRVLLVEDEMMVAMLVEDMLRDLGCELVATAARSENALATLDTQDVDVAILDVNLDGRESYDVAAALAARNIPFVFSTGYGELSLREDFRGRPVLKKPFRVEDLERVLCALPPLVKPLT